MKKDRIKTNTVKKYLFISSKSKLILVKINLFINIFFGLLNDKIWLIENLNNEYIFMNLNPELVEKKEPPSITSIRKTNTRFLGICSNEIPIFETLLEMETSTFKKLLL